MGLLLNCGKPEKHNPSGESAWSLSHLYSYCGINRGLSVAIKASEQWSFRLQSTVLLALFQLLQSELDDNRSPYLQRRCVKPGNNHWTWVWGHAQLLWLFPPSSPGTVIPKVSVDHGTSALYFGVRWDYMRKQGRILQIGWGVVCRSLL